MNRTDKATVGAIVGFLIIVILIVVLSVLVAQPQPCKLDVHKIHVKENFMSKQECETIMDLARSKLVDSKVYSKDADVLDTEHRKSRQHWMYDHDAPLVQEISNRVARWIGYSTKHQEALQVLINDVNCS